MNFCVKKEKHVVYFEPMKKWQLMAVVANEKALLDLISASIPGQEILPDEVVIRILAASNEEYAHCTDNYLRLYPLSPGIRDMGIKIIEKMPVLNAYIRYGGDAITEVIDYGSVRLVPG